MLEESRTLPRRPGDYRRRLLRHVEDRCEIHLGTACTPSLDEDDWAKVEKIGDYLNERFGDELAKMPKADLCHFLELLEPDHHPRRLLEVNRHREPAAVGLDQVHRRPPTMLSPRPNPEL